MNAEEYRTWLKKRRKKRIRLLAAVLCFCVLCTTYPNILETLSVIVFAETETETKTEITEAEPTQSPTPEPEQTPTQPLGPTQTSEAEESPTQAPEQSSEPEQTSTQAPEPTQPLESEQPPATEEPSEPEQPIAPEQPSESEQPSPTEEPSETEPSETQPLESEQPSETETLTEETETLTEETETETETELDDTQEEDLRALTELLTALPDPETYLTYDKAADRISEHEDLIDEAQLAEARKALDAYTDKYTTKNPATPNTDTPAEPASFPALIARLEGLEHLRDTREGCYDFDCPYHYPWFLKERMNQNETPALLTLEDLIEDYGVEPPAAADGRQKARAAARAWHPQTLMVTTDNENNAHTGSADGDLDTPMAHYKIIGDGSVVFTSQKHPLHPIEVSFTLDELPTRSAYVAIKTFALNHGGGSDYVYVNDDIYKPMDLTDEYKNEYNNENIGCLVEAHYTWSVTVLEIPKEKLVKGKNVISISAAMHDVFIVDWMQLILDGGAVNTDTNLENFVLTFKESAIEDRTAVFYANAYVSQKGDTQYATEYTLIREETGRARAVRLGNISETETAMLTMPLDSPSGTYRITGVLKDADTEKIMATDNVSFYFLKNVGIGVKTSHTLTPDTFTNRSVTIRVSAEATEGIDDTSVVPASRTVTQNGDYEFTVNYEKDREWYHYIYMVKVDNIDKEPPTIGYSAITVTERMTQAEFEKLFQEALTVTDNVTKECTVAYTLPKVEDVRANGGGQVKVTAQDALGNQSTQDCVLLAASPLTFSKPTADRQGTAKTFTLTAKLTAIGGKTVTESGFVWGIMANPTLSFNQGSAKTASPMTKANTSFSVKTTEIAEGMTYYARAYAKVGNLCYYSEPVSFIITAKDYGAFTIKNNNNNTFTVTRTGGTEGAQTVYYRTVNGSAIGGTHFTHQASSLTFKDGETQKTITITEQGVTKTYGSRTATAYSNADRTYQVELYRVKGGGTLGSTTTATRTMKKDSAYTISRSIYDVRSSNVMTNGLWDEKGSCHQFEITDGGDGECNGKNNGVNLYNGRTNHKGHKAKPFYLPRYHQVMPSVTDKEKAYFKDSIGTGDGWAYRYVLRQSRIETGWGHLWVGWQPAPAGGQTVSNKDGKAPLNVGSQKWAGYFDIDRENVDIKVPGGSVLSGSKENAATYTYGGNKYILFGTDQTAYMHFAACGSKNDVWKITAFTDYRMLVDTKEPQLLGVAPMAGGTYKQGDEITVSLVFDEIVDTQNSTQAGLNSLVAKTNWGDFTYAGGADTNILYFKGTVPANASGKISVSAITGAQKIKDLCDNTGGTVSAGTGSASVTVDTKKPTVTITNASLTNGTASAKITATNADTLQYTWSQSTTLPAAGWLTCKSGSTVSTRQASGQWYLHALATYEGTGASTYACSPVFDFGTPESPKFPLPELTVTTDKQQLDKREQNHHHQKTARGSSRQRDKTRRNDTGACK